MATLTKVEQVIGLLSGMDRNEIQQVRTHIRLLLDNTGAFTIGQKVSFYARGGRKIVGHIVKINVKTVHVREGAGTNPWRVSTALLRTED